MASGSIIGAFCTVFAGSLILGYTGAYVADEGNTACILDGLTRTADVFQQTYPVSTLVTEFQKTCDGRSAAMGNGTQYLVGWAVIDTTSSGWH